MDPLPAGGRRGAHADRGRRDRRGPPGAGRSRGRRALQPGRPAARPGAGWRGHARPGGLRGLLRPVLPRHAGPGARQRLPDLDGGGRRGRPAARLRRRPRRDAAELDQALHTRCGTHPRHGRLDRRAPPLPPPPDHRAQPARARARDDHPRAGGRRLRARAGGGHRGRGRRTDGERRDAARRHAGRAADPERGVRTARRRPPGGRHAWRSDDLGAAGVRPRRSDAPRRPGRGSPRRRTRGPRRPADRWPAG